MDGGGARPPVRHPAVIPLARPPNTILSTRNYGGPRMNHKSPILAALALAPLPILSCTGTHADKQPGAAAPGSPAATAPDTFRDTFTVDKSKLAHTGRGKYWVLEPGYTLTYKSADKETLTIRVLPDTKIVDGVTTRIVEEREEKNGALVEISRNFMALDPAPPHAGDIYYFGEETDLYKNGKITGHGGSWLSGVNGARFGLLVPGAPKPGDRAYQEIAPGVAMDRFEVLTIDETITVGGRVFEHCLHLLETTPLEKDKTNKWYAPGVGLIKDDEFELAASPAK